MPHPCLPHPCPPVPQQRLVLAVRLIVLGGGLALAPGLTMAQAQAQEPPPAAASAGYDIPPGPLSQALTRFASEAGIDLVGAGQAAEGRLSAGLKGHYGIADGLAALLAGTGLEAFRQGDGSYGLRPAPAPAESATPPGGPGQARPPSSETSLAPVTVTASGLTTPVTEGSRSYTTGATSTATKMSLSIRETPQSVTVVTRQRIDDQAMTNIVDAVRYTPGLFASNTDGVGRPNITARGFSASVMYEGFTSAWSSFLPSSQANLALFDRIEVVRGATGLAQGAGNPSAAINMVHKRPTHELKGSLTASVGSWDDYGLTADVGGPLNASGTVRARLVAAGQDAHTFRDVERHDHGLLYGVIEADVGPRTLVTAGAYRQTDYTNHFWYDLPISATGGHLGLPRSTFIGNDWEFAKNRVSTAFVTVEHSFASEWKLRLATLQTWRDLDLLGTATYRESANATGNDFYQSIWGGQYAYRHENYDVSAGGPFNLFGRRHQAIVGLTHQTLGVTNHNRDWTPSRIPGIDVFDHAPRATPMPVGQFTTTTRTATAQDSAYAAGQFQLAEDWRLLVGGRLDWYDYRDYNGSGSYKVPRNVTRYAALSYDFHRDHTVYTSYTDIFTPQTAKGIDGRILKPIVGENYELGVKGEYFGGALNATLAYFQINQTNRARVLDDQSTCPTFPETSCSEALGLVRTKGADFEVQGALTPNWQIGAGYTYADTRYVRDANVTRIGQRLTSSSNPQNLLKLMTMYRLTGNWDRWRVGGSLYWQSRLYATGTTAGISWRNEQDSYAVTDLIVGYRANPNLDFQLNVTNLFDRVYYRAVGYSTQWGTDVYGEPRKIKLTARLSF